MKQLNLKLSVAFICIVGFASSQIVTTLAGSNSIGSANGTGTAASFDYPAGLAADISGNLFVADENNNKIRMINISSGVVTTLAGSFAGSADGTGTAATFLAPLGVATDGIGNLYVADYGNNEIRKIVISSGVVTTFAGSKTQGSANGVGTAASFSSPAGIAADGIGNLYVADEGNNEIRKIVISTGMVSTLAGSTTSGSANGTGTAASFYNPTGVAIDGSGNLFVADEQNNEIRKIVISSGVVTTLAGSISIGSNNGTGTAAKFFYPMGVVADGKGDLYVADHQNSLIRQIVISSGVVTTLAGSFTGYANGTGTAASFNYPEGITIDAAGTLYVGDTYNNDVRMIEVVAGINELHASTEINIYPNPVNQILHIKLQQYQAYTAVLKINDITGREVIIQPVNKQQNTLSVDVSSLPQGIYFISLQSNNGEVITKKFLKQ